MTVCTMSYRCLDYQLWTYSFLTSLSIWEDHQGYCKLTASLLQMTVQFSKFFHLTWIGLQEKPLATIMDVKWISQSFPKLSKLTSWLLYCHIFNGFAKMYWKIFLCRIFEFNIQVLSKVISSLSIYRFSKLYKIILNYKIIKYKITIIQNKYKITLPFVKKLRSIKKYDIYALKRSTMTVKSSSNLFLRICD